MLVWRWSRSAYRNSFSMLTCEILPLSRLLTDVCLEGDGDALSIAGDKEIRANVIAPPECSLLSTLWKDRDRKRGVVLWYWSIRSSNGFVVALLRILA
jgi:hypothetical protein